MLGVIQRYKPVIDLLRKEGSRLKILDVGGGNESILPFVPRKDYDITSADVWFRGKKKVKTVKASADRLPFRDNSFDVAISVDMMEHIPGSKRKKAIAEMIRVASKLVVIACPCGEEAGRYERRMIRFAEKFGKKLPWLEEHRKNGLPDENGILKMISAKNVRVMKNENLSWAFILNFIEFGTNPLQKLIGARGMMAIYGPISKIFNFGKCYRRIFVIEK